MINWINTGIMGYSEIHVLRCKLEAPFDFLPRRGGVPTTGQSNCPRSGGPENFLDADAATGNMVFFCMILFPEVCTRETQCT